MRIISGRFRGRRLQAFKASHLRPTTDQIKEVIFNKLMGYVDGARVLDLFAGTGNLSIEALSRGASDVTAIEKHPKSVQIIRKNLTELDILSEIKLIQKDVFSFLKQAEQNPFDIILIDPPFTKKIADQVLVALSDTKLFHSDTQIFIESTKHEDINDQYGQIILQNRKSYGDKFLSNYIVSK